MRTLSTSVSLICANPIVSEGLKSILYDEEFSIVGLHKTCSAMILAKDQALVDVGMIVFDADATQCRGRGARYPRSIPEFANSSLA